jgi:hypothetical protein
MKRTRVPLIILLFALLLTTACSEPTITITIIIPKELVPYFDWAKDFPGWQIPQEQIQPDSPIPVFNSYQSVTPIHSLIIVSKLSRNIQDI